MTATRSYELTLEQVLEICQALKFHADALKQATSLWQLIRQAGRGDPVSPPSEPQG